MNLKPNIPALPMFEDKTKIDVRYALISPFAFVHIYWDSNINELLYELEEPILTEVDKKNLEIIERGMKETININFIGEKSKEAMMDYIDKTAKFLISEFGMKIEKPDYDKIFYYLFRNFSGLNEIEAVMRDYFIEDIECNGANTPVYVIHRIYRNLRTNIIFNDIDYLENFVEKLAQRTGRYISYASPLLDGSLEDGSRVNASYTNDVTSR